jgi:hypothetical protein
MRKHPTFEMFKLAAILCMVVFQAISMARLSMGSDQANLDVLLQPRVFSRSTAAPNLNSVQFSIKGFKSPFILHLRNGDPNGENRVSSARVSLNGTVLFGPSKFSQQVSGYDVEVALTEPSTMQVQLNSAPESKLTIWIEGVKENNIGPEGGTLVFANGVILDFPPGAVDKDTLIEITDLDLDEANDVVGPNQFNGRMRVLGGFGAKPEGLQFSLPIKATFGILPLEPGELPVPIELFPGQPNYQLRTTELLYDGEKGVVEMQIDHFSGAAAAGFNRTGLSEMTIEACANNAEVAYQICMSKDLPEDTKEGICQGEREHYWEQCIQFVREREYCVNPDSCGTFLDNEKFCASVDTSQPACCRMSKSAREGCFTAETCNCCKEKRIWVKVEEVDWQGGSQCQIINGKVEVKFLDCPGEPLQQIGIAGSTCKVDVVVSGPSTLDVGQTATYAATITEKDTGKVFKEIPLTWSTPDTDILEIASVTGQTTTVKGLKPGGTVLLAKTPDPAQFGFLGVTVMGPEVVSLSLDPSEAVLCIVDLTITASPKDANGNVISGLQITWTSSDPSLAYISAEGSNYIVVTRNPDLYGLVTITASVGGLTASAQIKVSGLASLAISPSDFTLDLGKTQYLSVTGKDYCGNNWVVLHDIEWTIPEGSVIAFDPYLGYVRGVNIGTATLRASAMGANAETTITVIARYSGSGSLSGSFSEGNCAWDCSMATNVSVTMVPYSGTAGWADITGTNVCTPTKPPPCSGGSGMVGPIRVPLGISGTSIVGSTQLFNLSGIFSGDNILLTITFGSASGNVTLTGRLVLSRQW